MSHGYVLLKGKSTNLMPRFRERGMVVRVVMATLLWAASAKACTNLIVSRGASADDSTHVAYNADADGSYGSVGLYPAAQHPPGTLRQIWDWDSSTYLGAIPEANHT